MLSYLFSNFQNIAAILETLALVIIGAFYLYGTYKGVDKSRQSESDGLADNLIKRLQQTVLQQTSDIKILQSQSEVQQREIHVLQGKNEAYLQIITLRDPAVAKVFEEAPEIYSIVRDTNKMVGDQVRALKDLTNAMETFINNLPPLTKTMTA